MYYLNYPKNHLLQIESEDQIKEFVFFETAGDLTKTSISLDMADIKLVDALNQVAEQVGWNYRIVEGLVIFSRKKVKPLN